MTGPLVPWESFTHDPRVRENASLRAADVDRAVIHHALTEAYADGRLDREEFDARAEAVLAARTLGELPQLVEDLVPTGTTDAASLVGADLRQQAVERWERTRREARWRFLVASLVCWTIWLVGSLGPDGFDPYFAWPIFVTLGTGIPLLRIQNAREEMIRDNQRRLEKKQRKELEGRRPEDDS